MFLVLVFITKIEKIIKTILKKDVSISSVVVVLNDKHLENEKKKL